MIRFVFQKVKFWQLLNPGAWKRQGDRRGAGGALTLVQVSDGQF